MSLFDKLGDKFSDLVGGKDKIVTQHVTEMLHGMEGGLEGLVQKFKAAGLEEQVASWIGKGKNLAISADKLRETLGAEQLNALAQKMGTSVDAAADRLVQVLPNLVDRLTPDGVAPKVEEWKASLQGLLGKLKD